MDEKTYEHKLRLLEIYQDNLRELELQAARFGVNPPLILLNEIKYHRQNIKDIRVSLDANEDEVTFDKLLFSIEELRNFAREEVKRAFELYNAVHQGDTARFWTAMVIFSGGTLIIGGIGFLCMRYIKGEPLGSQPGGVEVAIFFAGMTISLVLALYWGIREVRRQRAELIQTLGYDPNELIER